MKGVRYGGKPLGWRKPEGVRPQHQVRAYDDEWQLVKNFVKLMRKLGTVKTAEILKSFEDAN